MRTPENIPSCCIFALTEDGLSVDPSSTKRMPTRSGRSVSCSPIDDDTFNAASQSLKTGIRIVTVAAVFTERLPSIIGRLGKSSQHSAIFSCESSHYKLGISLLAKRHKASAGHSGL